MSRIERLCPNPADIEPVCFNLDPERALGHAQSIVDQLQLADGIRPAVGLIIPSALDEERILYGLRSSQSSEFPNAWGLPSTSISIDMFRNLMTQDGEMNPKTTAEIINILTDKKRKLPNLSLVPEKIVGWTGRARLQGNRYDGNYYLIMVDIKTAPVNPEVIPNSSIAYSEFNWLTPKDHMRAVEENPHRACGACSTLAFQAFLNNNERGI